MQCLAQVCTAPDSDRPLIQQRMGLLQEAVQDMGVDQCLVRSCG